MFKKSNFTADIIGVGNAITDVVCEVSESYLAEHNLTKGAMFLVDSANVKILEKLKEVQVNCGGSVANSIVTLGMLEVDAALVGKVGHDKSGDIFAKNLEQNGAKLICNKKGSSGSTARSFILLTPDGERTMCTYLGTASQIASEIKEEIIAKAKILYIEGYLWDEPETIAALRQAISIARENNVKIAFSLSDAFCVERHHDDFLQNLHDIDILFCNETEIEVLFGKDYAQNNYIKVLAAIKERNPNLIIAQTAGKEGAAVISGGKIRNIPTEVCKKVVDVTGAGDAFAAGFLYGFFNNLELEEAASLGNLLAGAVIQKIGARLTQKELTDLLAD